MSTPAPAQRRLSGDAGFAAAELPIAVTALILVMLLMIGGLRITNTRSDVQSAAHAGARAAAGERSMGAANAAASRVVNASLAARGVACASPSTSTSGNLSGGTVTVTVTCNVSLADVSLAGFGGSTTITATASERSDELRGAP
jgi:Flp pilus assembly protein TadG